MIPSLSNIPEAPQEHESATLIRQQTDDRFSSNDSQSKIDLYGIMPTRQTLNYVNETARNYMRRGGLNSDHLEQLMKSSPDWKSKLTSKDAMLVDILLRENVALYAEENQNMTIYALRKKYKNDLEINFLCNVVKNLAFFSNPSSVQSEVKDSSSFKKIINALSYRSIKKHEIIFNHGEKGKELFTVIKGSALCLIPDPSYRKKADLQPKKIEIIKEQQGETKAEGAARSFLNTLAQGVNKKAVVDTNVKSFIDNLKTQFQSKQAVASRGFLKRSSTRQLEDMINEEERTKANLTDSEFIKHYFPNFIHVKTFVPGESFGEIALLTSQGRTATLVSRENSEFMILEKDGFEKAMASMKKNVITEKIEFIKSFDFFSSISIRKVLQVIQQVRILRCEVKQSVYDEGNNSNFLFLIKEGEVELRSRYANPEELAKELKIDDEDDVNQVIEYEQLRKKKRKVNVSKMVTVKILGKGSFFGEEEIVKGQAKRQSSAICHSQNTEIYAIEKSKLQVTIGFNIFDKMKDQVVLKEEMKEERLKNAIKMQIPQSDIENLSSFLQKDKEDKEKQEQKERLKLELARKLKTNFQNRFEPNNQLDTTIEVTDSDLQDYNEAKALESQRKAFSQMRLISLALEPTPSSSNLMSILNPQLDKQIKAKLNRQSDEQIIEDNNNSKLKPKTEGQRSRNRIQSTFSNAEEDFLSVIGPNLQVKSFQNLLDLEDKPNGEETNLKPSDHFHYQGNDIHHSSGRSLLINHREGSESSIEGLNQSPNKTTTSSKQKKIVLHINKSRSSFQVLDSTSSNNNNSSSNTNQLQQQQQQQSLTSCRSDTSSTNNFQGINTLVPNQNQNAYLTSYFVKPFVKSHQQSFTSAKNQNYSNNNTLDAPAILVEGQNQSDEVFMNQTEPSSQYLKVPKIQIENIKQKQEEIEDTSCKDDNYNIISSSQRSQRGNNISYIVHKPHEEQIQEIESAYEQSEKRNFQHTLSNESAAAGSNSISCFLQTQPIDNNTRETAQIRSLLKRNPERINKNQSYRQFHSVSRFEISPQKQNLNATIGYNNNLTKLDSNPSFIVRNIPSTSKDSRGNLSSTKSQFFKRSDESVSKERNRLPGNFFMRERINLKDIAPHEIRQLPQKFNAKQLEEGLLFQTGFSHFKANKQPQQINYPGIQITNIPKSQSLIIKPASQLAALRTQVDGSGKGQQLLQSHSQQSSQQQDQFQQDISLVQYLKSNVEKKKLPDKFSTLPTSIIQREGEQKQKVQSMLRFRRTIQTEQSSEQTLHKQLLAATQDGFTYEPSNNTASLSLLAPLSSRKDQVRKSLQAIR